MSERFQRLFCAGCFAVVLMALPGALREAQRSLGGPYRVAARTLGSPALAFIAPVAPPVGPPVVTLDTSGAPSSTVVRVNQAPAGASAVARDGAAPVSVLAQIRTVAASDRPVLFRDGLARPGI